MKTRVIKIDPESIELDKIKNIAEILLKKGVIAYPTDTFYGLGGGCFFKNAIQKIYLLKGRELSKPLSIIISDVDMIQTVTVDIPSLFWDLSARFWPGPLTIVLKASSQLPREMLGPDESIGVRLPSLPWLRKLVKEASFPITATSANISGEKEIADGGQIQGLFKGKVDCIVDGGTTRGGLPSTVVNLAAKEPKIIREGAVPGSAFEEFLSR